MTNIIYCSAIITNHCNDCFLNMKQKMNGVKCPNCRTDILMHIKLYNI